MANLFIDKRASNSAVDEWGHEGNDTLLGSRFGDKLKGAQGNDTIHGNGGDDQIMDITWIGFEPNFNGLFSFNRESEGGRLAISNFVSGNIEIGAQSLGQVFFHGGNDRFFGGTGRDYLLGLEGNDVLDGGADLDVLLGGTGNDTLVGGAGNDILGGDNGNDYLLGGSGNDLLNGGGGDDRLEGSSGADSFVGGQGSDTVVYSQSFAAIHINLRIGATALDTPSGSEATGDSFESIENVIGSRHNDIITGTDGENDLFGGFGNDLLFGGAGGDILDGDVGVDTASYGSSAGGVRVTLNDATLGLGSFAAGGDAEDDTLISIENLIGSNFVDRLTGNSGRNTINGGNGDDIIHGLDGTDIILGGAGSDQLFGGNQNDTLNGGDGDDEIDGGANTDTVTYATQRLGIDIDLGDGDSAGRATTAPIGLIGAEEDRLFSIENIVGTSVKDTLAGNTSRNTINGGGGDDSLVFTTGGDRLDGDAGIDRLVFQNFTEAANIDLGSQVTVGASTIVTTLVEIENVLAGNGSDVIRGTTGDNTIEGSGGFDTMTGLGGNDTFVFRRLADIGLVAGQRDIITDFSAGDRIDFSALAGTEGQAGLDLIFIGDDGFSGEAGEIRFNVNNGGNTIVQIDLDGDGQEDAKLQLTGSVALTDADFLF
ncbi:hypothetical protein IHQ71_05885 [Rhizobium sp. TH2]|uniref:calcium-binding protein n=1 Tax=Rhizobium sp. TH2 TaxID=2775403 RepID=UPI0021578829|nr:calcium-binding protein [Rhizobium sp. TH2]UVC10134.1 hypothetical protein IHQ71_05885 [Rhizobium sp. TH2]